MAIVGVDDSSLQVDSQPKLVDLFSNYVPKSKLSTLLAHIKNSLLYDTVWYMTLIDIIIVQCLITANYSQHNQYKTQPISHLFARWKLQQQITSDWCNSQKLSLVTCVQQYLIATQPSTINLLAVCRWEQHQSRTNGEYLQLFTVAQNFEFISTCKKTKECRKDMIQSHLVWINQIKSTLLLLTSS